MLTVLQLASCQLMPIQLLHVHHPTGLQRPGQLLALCRQPELQQRPPRGVAPSAACGGTAALASARALTKPASRSPSMPHLQLYL